MSGFSLSLSLTSAGLAASGARFVVRIWARIGSNPVCSPTRLNLSNAARRAPAAGFSVGQCRTARRTRNSVRDGCMHLTDEVAQGPSPKSSGHIGSVLQVQCRRCAAACGHCPSHAALPFHTQMQHAKRKAVVSKDLIPRTVAERYSRK